MLRRLFFSFVVCLFMFPVFSDAALIKAPTTRGLVGYWSLNEGTSTVVTDMSGNGNNGVITSPVWVAGKSGKALTFDGTGGQYVTIPTSSTLDQTSAFSVGAWVYLNATGGNFGIIEKTVGGAVNTQFLLFVEGGTFRFRVSNGGLNSISSIAAAPTGRWVHVMGTYDGTSMKLYVDGVIQSTAFVAAPISGGAGVTLIGTLGSSVYRMNGMIDEARVYNRALSLSEVVLIAKYTPATTKVSSKTGLVAHWTLDEGRGGSLGATTGRTRQ